jgi:hypothetical protein
MTAQKDLLFWQNYGMIIIEKTRMKKDAYCMTKNDKRMRRWRILLGILIVIRLVKKSLEKFRSQTVYAIIGLMAGSLYAVVKGPQSLDTPQPAMTFDTFSIVFFIIGGAVIGGLQLMQFLMEKKKAK